MRLSSYKKGVVVRVLALFAALYIMQPHSAKAGGFVVDVVTEIETTAQAVGDAFQWLNQDSEWIDTHMSRIKTFLHTRLESLKTHVREMGKSAYEQDVALHTAMGKNNAELLSQAVQPATSTACAKALLANNARQLYSMTGAMAQSYMGIHSVEGLPQTSSQKATRTNVDVYERCVKIGPSSGGGAPKYWFTKGANSTSILAIQKTCANAAIPSGG